MDTITVQDRVAQWLEERIAAIRAASTEALIAELASLTIDRREFRRICEVSEDLAVLRAALAMKGRADAQTYCDLRKSIARLDRKERATL